MCNELDVTVTKHCIFVKISEQKLYFFENLTFLKSFPISTSRNEPSCVENSQGTPLGLHFIDGKIGNGESKDTVFIGRKPVGKISEQNDQSVNMITTRIMRLRGLEVGKNSEGNVDTFNRYVYIHGTNQHDKIGSPNSHGCILLSPDDMICLYDLIDDKSIVYISM